MKNIPFSDVRAFYQRNQPDGHWFDAGTMLFFKTKLPEVAYDGDAGVLFTTRETNPSGESKYTVRRQKPSGLIETVGDFHKYVTAADARAEIKRLHSGGAA